jgi:hypothetical protein
MIEEIRVLVQDPAHLSGLVTIALLPGHDALLGEMTFDTYITSGTVKEASGKCNCLHGAWLISSLGQATFLTRPGFVIARPFLTGALAAAAFRRGFLTETGFSFVMRDSLPPKATIRACGLL